MAGLIPDNIRLDQPLGPSPAAISVELDDISSDDVKLDSRGNILEIHHGDGSLTISLDGRPIKSAASTRNGGWYDNLVEDIDTSELSRIADDLLRGIADDESSRRDWLDARALGLQLLGLKIEVPGLQGASDGAPVEGMSKIRHPLLLEACLRSQANMRSEMLPTDGPVKIRNDGSGDPQEDSDANALQLDFNHYLTARATEYYPDTDRMFFMYSFGGTSFKKVYFCPLRMRPVSETVDASDLIVNNTAVDLANASRVTHRVMMKPSTVRRLQILGVYRDISLTTPSEPQTDPVKQEKADQQGVALSTPNPEDREREIYECYCELNISGFEHKFKGKPSGLDIPYRVTLDVTSREILSIVRNYHEPDVTKSNPLPVARKTFVKYTYVPGLGFYDIGLLHILGNTTNALTAAVREMLDNGMYANFPGFLLADTGARQNTNLFRVPPGGAALVKTGGMKLSDAVMPLPYNTAQMAPLLQLVQAMAADGQRLGGTSELQVGEGRPDAPVGTTLALIEQATKIENSVHKRAHISQAEEFKLLVECFREHPESFFECDCPSGHGWNETSLLAALNNCDLVPQADPNTASYGQRIMKVQALNLWAQQNQELANPVAIAKVSLMALGWNNPEQFMQPPSAMAQPPPELLEAQAKIANDGKKADADMLQAQARMVEAQGRAKSDALAANQPAAPPPPPNPIEVQNAQTKAFDAQTKRHALGVQLHEMQLEDANRDQDRAAKLHAEYLGIAKEVLSNPDRAEAGAGKVKSVEKEVGAE